MSNEPVPVLLQPPLVSFQTERSTVGEIPVVARGQLSDSAALLYTAPDVDPLLSGTSRIKSINLCNGDSSARTVTLYLVPAGDSAADDVAILIQEPLAAKGTVTCSKILLYGDGLTLEAGETIYGLASVAAKVTYRIEILERR